MRWIVGYAIAVIVLGLLVFYGWRIQSIESRIVGLEVTEKAIFDGQVDSSIPSFFNNDKSGQWILRRMEKPCGCKSICEHDAHCGMPICKIEHPLAKPLSLEEINRMNKNWTEDQWQEWLMGRLKLR